MKRPVAVSSDSVARGQVFPRGVSIPRKTKAMQLLLQAIAERAEAACGICEAPLLAHWGYCPSCGQAIDWEG
jgi:hypothetical protein